MISPVWRRSILSAALCIACLEASGQARSLPDSSVPTQPASTRALTRAQAELLLLEHNPEIRLARAALQAAGADIRRADIAPNPNLSVSISNTTARQYRAGQADRILRVEQLLERGDKRALRTAGARLLETAAQADVLDTIRQQRGALATAYHDLAAAQRIERLTRDHAARYRALVEASERRVRAGDLAAVDLARMRVEAARSAQDARSAEADTIAARLTLGSLLGLTDDAAALQAADDLPAADIADAIGLPPTADQVAAAVEHRADALAARARLEAAGRAHELAARQRTRDLLIGVQTEHAPSFGGSVFGVSLSVPLLIGNDYAGDIARAKAEETIAGEMLARTRALVRAEIERAAERLASARDRARLAAERALPDARRAADGIEFAFARGAASLTDLFDARRQLGAVQIEAARALSELAAAVEVYRAAIDLQVPK